MFVRVKEVAGRRYLYVVDGRRRGKKVRQRVLCYLGTLTTLASGIPEDMKRRVERENPDILDWKKIIEQVKRIPLRFEEISDIRKRQYALAIKARNLPLKLPPPEVKMTPSAVFEQRRDGELSALSRLAARGFRETYEELGEGRYRMRL
ncbi:MAG: hypothetical protein ACE5NN_04620 [Candidatus Bathyarchaeia archaeon]